MAIATVPFARARAQDVRVRLIDGGTRAPMAGVLVSTLNLRGEQGAAVLSSADGIVLVRPEPHIPVRLLVRRIGFAPTTVGPIAIGADSLQATDVVVPALTPIVLSTVHVTEHMTCPSRAESPAENARQAWGEVRAALEASRLTRSQRLVVTSGIVFRRAVRLDGTIDRTDTTARGSSGARPFVSPGAAILERDGYFKAHDDGSADFYGPDEDVLLSPGFTRRHCVILSSSARRDSAGVQLALAFLPRDNDNRPEIRGVMWVDSATSELRRIQFDYVNIPPAVAADSLGGSVDFAHLASGAWIVSSWVLRIPHVDGRMAILGGSRILRRNEAKSRVDSYVDVGGTAVATRDIEIPGPAVPRTIAGVVYDSLAGRPLAGAHVHIADLGREATSDSLGAFRFDSVPRGVHEVWADHRVLDSVGIFTISASVDVTPLATTELPLATPSFATLWERACGAPAAPDSSAALLFGSVHEAGAGAPGTATVQVAWDPGSGGTAAGARERAARADPDGNYALCGVPVARALTLNASAGTAAARAMRVRVGAERVARADLTLLSKTALDSISADSARGAGSGRHRLRVLASGGEPVAYANVTVNGGATRITDLHGEIALGAGAVGSPMFIVRRIGFEAWSGRVAVPDSNSVSVVTLKPLAQSLAGIRVTTSKRAVSPYVQGFYDRWEEAQKGALTATFIGPEELEFRHPDKISHMLAGLNGVRLVCDEHGDCVIHSSHEGDLLMGNGCPMAIMLDGKQVFGTSLNVDRLIDANDIMAIEVYPRAGNMPVSLQADDTKCGVVAFWSGSRK